MATYGNFNNGNNFTYTYAGISITCNASWSSSISRGGTSNKATVNLSVTVRHISGDESGYAMYYSTGNPATSTWHLLASNNQTHYVGGSTTLSGSYKQTVGDAAGTLTGYVIIAVGQTNTSYVSFSAPYSLSYGAKTAYTIAYNGNGGSGAVSSQTKYYGTNISLRSNAYTRAGYTFKNWNTSANGSGTAYSAGGTYSTNAGATMYAQWEAAGSVVSVSDWSGYTLPITVTKPINTYCHSLSYTFGSMSGYIGSDGTISSTRTIYSSTSVSADFSGTDLYSQMPSEQTKTGIITCTTYTDSSGTTLVGTTTCEFTVTATSAIAPTITNAGYQATDTATTALTGSNQKVIRNRSSVQVQFTATARSSSVMRAGINNVYNTEITLNPYTMQNTFVRISTLSFTLSAMDGRGLERTGTLSISSANCVNYTDLIASTTISRPSKTSTSLIFDITGTACDIDFRSGVPNRIWISYSATATDHTTKSGTLVDGAEIGSANFTVDSNGNFAKSYTVTDFDYAKTWDITVTVRDGGIVSNTNYYLTTQLQSINGIAGIPVFDWGNNDFNFNVPVFYTDGSGNQYPMLTQDKLQAGEGSYDVVSAASSAAVKLGTVSLAPGFWVVVVTGRFTANVYGARELWLASDDTGTLISNGTDVLVSASQSGQTRIQLVYPVKVTTATTLYVFCGQNSGSTLSANGYWSKIGVLI